MFTGNGSLTSHKPLLLRDMWKIRNSKSGQILLLFLLIPQKDQKQTVNAPLSVYKAWYMFYLCAMWAHLLSKTIKNTSESHTVHTQVHFDSIPHRPASLSLFKDTYNVGFGLFMGVVVNKKLD